MFRSLLSAGAALLLVCGSTAQALTIATQVTTPDASTRSGGSGSYGSDNSGTTTAVAASAIQNVVESAGQVGQATGEYLHQSWGDSVWSLEDHTFSHTLTTTFTITPDSLVRQYNVILNTTRAGELGTEDDGGSSWIYASAHLGALTGTINGGAEALLGLAAADVAEGTYDSGTGPRTDVDQTSGFASYENLTGVQVFEVVTTWTSRVYSNYDESLISLGQDMNESWMENILAADSGDGVHTHATVTVIPEPSTALLIGLGLVGLAAKRRDFR